MVLLSREVSRTSLCVILFVLSLLFSSCESKTDMTMLETLAAMNQPTYLGKPVSSETVRRSVQKRGDKIFGDRRSDADDC